MYFFCLAFDAFFFILMIGECAQDFVEGAIRLFPSHASVHMPMNVTRTRTHRARVSEIQHRSTEIFSSGKKVCDTFSSATSEKPGSKSTPGVPRLHVKT